jgi:hypothetical protein
MEYDQYIKRKLSTVPSTGISGAFDLPASMFPHQRALAGWAVKRGRAAIFADTGLGKSRMQLAWADAVLRHTLRPVLILAPLALASQLAIFPLFDIHVSLETNIWIGAWFTAISLVRSYVIRRWFNARLHRAAIKMAHAVN